MGVAPWSHPVTDPATLSLPTKALGGKIVWRHHMLVEGMASLGMADLDNQVRTLNGQGDQKVEIESSESLQKLLEQAVESLAESEREVVRRKNEVSELQGRLNNLIDGQTQITISTRKDDITNTENKDDCTNSKNKDDSEQKNKQSQEIRRKWRVLGAKVRVGVTTTVLKRRKMNDPTTFMDRETEEVTKEDKMDLEGNTVRQKEVKRRWRKAGMGVTNLQGRDCVF